MHVYVSKAPTEVNTKNSKKPLPYFGAGKEIRTTKMLLGKSPVNWTWGCGPVDLGHKRAAGLHGQTRRCKLLRLASGRCLHVTCATSEVWGQKNSSLHANTTTCIFTACISKSGLTCFSLQASFQFWDHLPYPPSNRVVRTPPLITNPILSRGGSSIRFSWREAQIPRHVFVFSGTPKPTSLPYRPQCAEAH